MSGGLKERIERPTIAERVAAGVRWLDVNRPGWDDQIDLTRLVLSSPCFCVLGQLDGSYDESPALDEIDDPDTLGFNADARPDLGLRGFSDRMMADFEALDAEWKRVIAGRRAER